MAANNQLNGLVGVPAGYFLTVREKNYIVNKYPELKQLFDNAMEVTSGSYMTDQTTVNLSNKISDLQYNDKVKDAKIKALQESLNSERAGWKAERLSFQNQLDDKDKVNELLQTQVNNWKERYNQAKSMSFTTKAGYAAGGAGAVALLVLLGSLTK